MVASGAAAGAGYECNGNLTFDGTRTFTYDGENRLLSERGPVTLNLALVGEYPSIGNVPLRRYVHGPGVDNPMIWFEGAGVTSANASYLVADRQGSIIAIANAAGAMTNTYTYDPYGVPNTWGGSRFRYTGQIEIPEAQLYYYKARVYDPASGRFLQADPIGTKDDLDLYAYVGDDPADRADPTGENGLSDAANFIANVASDPQTYVAAGEMFGGGVLIGAGIVGDGGAAVGEGTTLGAGTPIALPVAIASTGAIAAGAGIAADGNQRFHAVFSRAAEARAANQAKGIPSSRLGPSGKPKMHDVDHSSRKAAREAAGRDAPKGGSVRSDASPANDKQGPHFQAEDAKGDNVKPVVHHNCPE